MNPIGQKIAQLLHATNTLANTQKSGMALQTALGKSAHKPPKAMAHKASLLSQRFIQTAGPNALKESTPKIKNRYGEHFLGAKELTPIRDMYTAAHEFADQFDNQALASRRLNQFSWACYKLQSARENNEVEIATSWVKVCLDKSLKMLELSVHPDENPSPEAIDGFKELQMLYKDSARFLTHYKKSQS